MDDATSAELRRLEGELRQVVANEIAEQQARAEEGSRALDVVDQRQIARAVLRRELDLHAREALRQGQLPLPDGEREDLANRVMTQVFTSLPGLEAFIERPDAINIHVLGSREVIVELLDGTKERHPSPYASDAEVIEAVAHMARRGGLVEREFNYSHPILHLALPDGSRLAANAWIGPEPYVTVRRHPLVDHDLDDLRDRGMFDQGLRTFLGAAVRAKWNILVAGAQGNGKTTLLRALSHEAHPDERLIVLESEPELGLDRLPHRHSHVVNLAERPGNMAGEGAVTLHQLGWHAKRLEPWRLLVGEVLADEVVAMLEIMTQGVRGSMATIHAESSAAVFPRLPVYARSSGRDWRSGDILALAAVALNLVVFVHRDWDDRRVVGEVRHVDRYDPHSEQIISDAWFLPDPETRRAVPAGLIPVQMLDELVGHGYDPSRHETVRGNGHRVEGSRR
jgi:pilus assembly protein CpaF